MKKRLGDFMVSIQKAFIEHLLYARHFSTKRRVFPDRNKKGKIK